MSRRFKLCVKEFLAARRAGQTPKREHLKRWGAMKIAEQRDRLSERPELGQKFALGALRSVCWKAGKDESWIDQHFFSLFDKRPELIRHGRLRCPAHTSDPSYGCAECARIHLDATAS